MDSRRGANDVGINNSLPLDNSDVYMVRGTSQAPFDGSLVIRERSRLHIRLASLGGHAQVQLSAAPDRLC